MEQCSKDVLEPTFNKLFGALCKQPVKYVRLVTYIFSLLNVRRLICGRVDATQASGNRQTIVGAPSCWIIAFKLSLAFVQDTFMLVTLLAYCINFQIMNGMSLTATPAWNHIPVESNLPLIDRYLPTYILYFYLPNGAFQEQWFKLLKLLTTIQLKLIKFKKHLQHCLWFVINKNAKNKWSLRSIYKIV